MSIRAFTAVLMLILSAASAAPAGTIVEYTFADGGSSTADNTGTLGAAMDGSITGGSIVSSPYSPDGKALLLGGSTGDGVSMADGYDFGSAFTVEALVRLDALQSGTNMIFDDYGTPGVMLKVDTAPQSLRLWTTTADDGNVVVLDSAPFTLGSWHHVAGVYDGASIKLYVDGTEVDSQPASGVVLNQAGLTPNAGVELNDASFPWQGAIDDFRIHDSALGVGELNAGNPMPVVPLPGAAAMALAGLAVLLLVRRRRRLSTAA